MTEYTKIDISFASFVRPILVVLAFVFLYLIRDVVAVVIFAVVLASAADPAARWFQKKRIPRVLAVIIIYILSFFILGVAFSLIIPNLFSELSTFSAQIPLLVESIQGKGAIFEVLPELPGYVAQPLADFFGEINSRLGEFAGGLFRATAVVFGGATSFLLIIVLSFYLSVQERGIENFLRIVTPKKHEEYVLNLWSRAWLKVGRWFQTQILLGVLVGVIVYLGLTILQVKFALSLAILAAIFELIPLFGPILAAIPAVAIAFLQDPTLALIVIVFYFVVQQFENHLLVPTIFKKAVGVPPILVVVSLIVGWNLGGFFGILLAVPLAAVFIEFLNDIAVRKHTFFS